MITILGYHIGHLNLNKFICTCKYVNLIFSYHIGHMNPIIYIH